MLGRENFWDFAIASLVIRSEELEAADITRILSIEPMHMHAKGERMTKRGPRLAVYEMNVWSVDSDPPTTIPLSVHITDLLDLLEPVGDAVATLTAQCEIYFFCSFSDEHGQGHCRLNHRLWQRLARLPVPLVLSPCPPSVDAEHEWLDANSTDVVPLDNMVDDDSLLLRKWTAGMLTIRSDTRSAEEITQVLGIVPTRVRAQKGAPRSEAVQQHRAFTVWQHESGQPSTAPLEDHLVALLDRIEAQATSFDLFAAQCDLSLSLGFAAENSQGGAWLDHAVVERIARLPVGVTIYLYPPSVDIWRALAEEAE